MEKELRFESHPGSSLRVWLFEDVENMRDIREQVVSGKLQPEFAFFNAQLVAGLHVVHLAACKALWLETAGARRTRSLHTELLCNISGSKHIASSLQRFGIGDDTKHVLVARFDGTASDGDVLRSVLKAKQVEIEKLSSVLDESQVKKIYKIVNEELSIGTLADAVTCQIAAHDL